MRIRHWYNMLPDILGPVDIRIHTRMRRLLPRYPPSTCSVPGPIHSGRRGIEEPETKGQAPNRISQNLSSSSFFFLFLPIKKLFNPVQSQLEKLIRAINFHIQKLAE
jgi:hypothetical protein